MFKKKKSEDVEAQTITTEETGAKTSEMPKISEKAMKELKGLSEALNAKYAYYFTPDEASQTPGYIHSTLQIALLLAIYDELKQIRTLNE